MRSAIYLVSLLCAASIARADDSARAKSEDDIREALFRYQFEHNESFLQQKAKVYFLSIGEGQAEPTDEFMKRFAVPKPTATTVKKVSQSEGGKDGVRDKETGERGLIFRVTTIKWVTNAEVEVKGGYHEGPRSSSGNTYYMNYENGKWVITKNVINWIS